METLMHMLHGVGIAMMPVNLAFCAIGVIIGTIVGAMPGIGPAGSLAILLPVTFKMEPITALIMLCGLFYGTQYGGTITSVLMRIPGESASVVTMFDGNPLAKQGKAGVALGIAAVGSFVGGTASVVALVAFGPPLAEVAFKMGPPEYFALMVMALSLVVAFSSDSAVRGLIATCLGLILAMVGQDVMTGQPRLTFDSLDLIDGIDFLPVAVGLFGMSEMIEYFEKRNPIEMLKAKLGFFDVLPSLRDLKESFWPMVRGTIIGFILGLFPGAGATVSSFVSYGIEQRVSKHPEQFGHGALAGVAGPETANNAAVGGHMIPMLSLGIPCSASTALLLTCLIMFGLKPGPTLFIKAPDVVWGLIGSFYIANVMLVIINLACIPVIVSIMNRVMGYLPIIVILLSAFGVYSYRNSGFDIGIMLASGVVGYGMTKAALPLAPVIMGILLGGQMENGLRQSLVLSGGSPMIFLTHPISAVLFAITFTSLLLPFVLRVLRGRRKKAE